MCFGFSARKSRDGEAAQKSGRGSPPSTAASGTANGSASPLQVATSRMSNAGAGTPGSSDARLASPAGKGGGWFKSGNQMGVGDSSPNNNGPPPDSSHVQRIASSDQAHRPPLPNNRMLSRAASDKFTGDRAAQMIGGSDVSSSSNALPNSGRASGRITQNLTSPKNPQFSLSKKKPKDAATEAKLQEEASKLDELLQNSHLRAFSYAELKAFTKNFSNDMLVGIGGFGKVYRGVVRSQPAKGPYPGLPDDTVVAIKKLDSKSLQGHKEWMVEICMLGQVDHPNLVKLLGFCAEGDKRLLMYEFLPFESLDKYLFGLDPSRPIPDWRTRIKIAMHSAKGLAHLHDEISPSIIYRDFKTSNVLLDEDFNAKLSDFGLAREGPAQDRTHVSTQVRGTAGYAAPEYMLTGHLTPKADVWSFGVVLLELLTGRPSMDQRKPPHEMKLVPFARPYLANPSDIVQIMDERLEGEYTEQAAERVAELAGWCLATDPTTRPTMTEITQVLAYLHQHLQ